VRALPQCTTMNRTEGVSVSDPRHGARHAVQRDAVAHTVGCVGGSRLTTWKRAQTAAPSVEADVHVARRQDAPECPTADSVDTQRLAC
jgi:hypothetical protein